MYNSIFVNLLVKLWQWIVKAYEGSLLKRILGFFIKGIKKISSGSFVVQVITTENKATKNSLVYRIYESIIDLYNKIILKLNKLVGNYKRGSKVTTRIKSLHRAECRVLETHLTLIGSLILGLTVINMIINKSINKNHILMIISVAIIFKGLAYSSEIIEFFKESYIYEMGRSLMSAEEGSDGWW